MADDDISRSIVAKIEREKTLINAANQMRQSTNNPLVVQGLDTKIRDGRKNIDYLEGRLREHQMKLASQKMAQMNLEHGESSGHGDQGGQHPGYDRGQPGQMGLPQPNAQFQQPGPGQGMPKARPNYTKLGELKVVIARTTTTTTTRLIARQT
jgi:hypothetical protein